MNSNFDDVKHFFSKTHEYGSRYIGNFKEDSDYDFLCLVSRLNSSQVDYILKSKGYVSDLKKDSFEYSSASNIFQSPHLGELVQNVYEGFESYRKGEVNLVITFDENFYNKAVAATKLCRKLKLKNKEDIILVHDIVVRENHESIT